MHAFLSVSFSLRLLRGPLLLCMSMCVCVCVCVRYERLEDQLNDLTELHQNETGNLKQELASIEEKVAYQAYERARDIQVMQPVTSPRHGSPDWTSRAPDRRFRER